MNSWTEWIRYFARLLDAGYEATYLDYMATQACIRWPLEDGHIRFAVTVLLMDKGLVRLALPHIIFTPTQEGTA